MNYEEIDVSYGNDERQQYDVYLPAGRIETATSPIILIHGGAWVCGNKEDVAGIVDQLKITMPNHAIFNMDYRLNTKPNNSFEDQLTDVANVVAYVDLVRDYFNVRDDMIFIGVSVGGHMDMEYSYSNNVDDHVRIVANIVVPTYF